MKCFLVNETPALSWGGRPLGDRRLRMRCVVALGNGPTIAFEPRLAQAQPAISASAIIHWTEHL